MKKIIFLILSVCLSFIFALSGCSCVPEAYLEFENSITANIKTETLVYDVEYADTYKGIVCGQSVNKSLLPKYQNGKLTLYFNGSGQPLPTGVDKHINFDNISTFNYIMY